MPSSAFSTFDFQYTRNPIILTGGIATSQGNVLPIVALTDPQVIASGTNVDPNTLFASYRVLPGGSFVSNQVATYPFANQAVAANAIVAQPLNISVLMTCPATANVTLAQKQAVMHMLQASLTQHNNSGGMYSIFTPAYIYTSCIMVAMRDVTGPDTNQVQIAWELDFLQPLVTIAQAQNAKNTMLQKLSGTTAQASQAILSTALTSVGTTVNNFAGPLTSTLSSALNSVGLSTASLSPLITTTLTMAIGAGYSPSDLTGVLTQNLALLAAGKGVSFATLQELVGQSVTTALSAVGVRQPTLQALAVSALSQVISGPSGINYGSGLNVSAAIAAQEAAIK